jgi:hypothetical protein
MDDIDKLFQDMERELSRSLSNDSQIANGIEPVASNLHIGNGDETLSSASISVGNSCAEPNQTLQKGDSDGILLSIKNDAIVCFAELSQNFQKSDGDEIFPSTDIKSRYSFSEPSQHFKDDDERLTSYKTNTECCSAVLNSTPHQEEGKKIIWATATRLLKSHLKNDAKTYSDDESEKSLSSKDNLS